MSETNRFNRDFDSAAMQPLPLREVSVIRSLAIEIIRSKNNGRLNAVEHPELKKRAYRTVLYEGVKDAEIGSEVEETYLGLSVYKCGFVENGLRVSFLNYQLSEETRFSNERIVYAFDWIKRDVCVAGIKRTLFNRGPIRQPMLERVDPTTELGIGSDDIQGKLVNAEWQAEAVERSRFVEPLSLSECDEMYDRVASMASRFKLLDVA